MTQRFQPCCERVALEIADAPRTEGANAPADVIRCASCGSPVPVAEIAERKAAPTLAGVLTRKAKNSLRRKKPAAHVHEKINYWI